jgi:hypothetical protein
LAKPCKPTVIFRLKYFGNDSAFASYSLPSMENTRFFQTVSFNKGFFMLKYLTRAYTPQASPVHLAA